MRRPSAVDLEHATAPRHVDARLLEAIRSGTPWRYSGPTSHAPVASAVRSSVANQPSLIRTSLSTKAMNSVSTNGSASASGFARREAVRACGATSCRGETATSSSHSRTGDGEPPSTKITRAGVPAASRIASRHSARRREALRAGMTTIVVPAWSCRRRHRRRVAVSSCFPSAARCSSIAMAERTIAQIKRSTARPITAANCSCWNMYTCTTRIQMSSARSNQRNAASRDFRIRQMPMTTRTPATADAKVATFSDGFGDPGAVDADADGAAQRERPSKKKNVIDDDREAAPVAPRDVARPNAHRKRRNATGGRGGDAGASPSRLRICAAKSPRGRARRTDGARPAVARRRASRRRATSRTRARWRRRRRVRTSDWRASGTPGTTR